MQKGHGVLHRDLAVDVVFDESRREFGQARPAGGPLQGQAEGVECIEGHQVVGTQAPLYA